MMCDTTNRSFRNQLGAILEKLTKAVLVDVSNLADECSSALHSEISAHRSENEALKKKCFSLEIQLRAARGSAAATAAAAASHNNNYPTNNTTAASSSNNGTLRNSGPAAGGPEKFVRDQQQPAAAAAPPAIDGIFGKDWCMDLWRGEKQLPPATASKGTEEACTLRNNGPPVQPRPQGVDLMDGEPDLIFVKEEMYEDQPIGQQMRLSDNGKRGATIEEDGMDQRAVSDLRLHQGGLNNFPVTSAQPQGTPPVLMDGLIEGSTMSNLVDDVNRSTASGEYSDYMNNMQMNTSKDLANQHRAGKAPKQFECLFCGKVFNYLSSLKVHIRRHSGEKPFSCTVCGKRFAQKTYLKLHQRVHSGEKPYSCLECGRSFSQKGSLNMHLRTHTGEKPYSCVDCGKSYAYKYGFNQHKCFN